MDKELMQGQSFYQVLGVEPSASQSQVEDAYASKREELGSLTDDDTTSIQKALTLLERAYGTLSNADRRAEYDETLEEIARTTDAPAGSAIREYHTPEEAEPVDTDEDAILGSTIKESMSHQQRKPKLSGRLKATVTVPLSTITAAIREGGDLSLLDADPEMTGKKEETPALSRMRNEERVHSFATISESSEASRPQATPRAEEYRRERQPSLEVPRATVARLTREAEPEEQKTFIDFFLIFCAFVLPLTLLIVTAIQLLLS